MEFARKGAAPLAVTREAKPSQTKRLRPEHAAQARLFADARGVGHRLHSQILVQFVHFVLQCAVHYVQYVSGAEENRVACQSASGSGVNQRKLFLRRG
jgi:hypothetical protein